MNFMYGHDDVQIYQHPKHPGNTAQVRYVAILISLLIDERGLLVSHIGHGQPDVVTKVVSIECTEHAEQ